MRKSLGLLISSLLILGFVGSASASTLDWHGTVVVDLGALKDVVITGSGVATVNGSAGGNHLNTLRIAGGLTGSGTVPVTDPTASGTLHQIIISGTIGTGTFSGISGGAPLNPPAVLGLKGFTRVCLVVNCADGGLSFDLNNTTNNGATGIGIGGALGMGVTPVIISIHGAPWTLGTASGINQTLKGAFVTQTAVGFVHGALSANSSTATGSGVIQLISPQQVTVSGLLSNSAKISLFTTLTLHFIPEPGLLLLIGSGVVGLGVLGRSRMKK